MKKIALIAMTAAAAIATPAMAQTTDVTGTIIITGTVAKKCFVQGGTSGSTFGTTVALGELSKDDGTLKDASELSNTFNTVGTTGIDARVVCTSATPNVSVLAEPLLNSAATADGYTNRVNYTADVKFKLAGGTDQTVSDASIDTAATTGTLGTRLLGTGTNIQVRTSNWAATGVLVSGSYAGKITVVVAPGA